MVSRESTGHGRSLVALSDRHQDGRDDGDGLAALAGPDDGIAVHWSEPLPEQMWASPLRLGVVGSNLLGGALIASGWALVSGTRVVDDQMGGTVLAVVGVGIAALGQVSWLIAGRRALGRGFAAVLPAPQSRTVENGAEQTVVEDDGQLVAVQGGAGLYHRPRCPFAAGKAVIPGDRTFHQQAGRSACAVCEP